MTELFDFRISTRVGLRMIATKATKDMEEAKWKSDRQMPMPGTMYWAQLHEQSAQNSEV